MSRDVNRGPQGDVLLIAGTPPGGGQDRAARALVAALAEVLSAEVRISNIPGRGGGNAWDELAAHPGDPRRLAISSPTIITNSLTGIAQVGADALEHVALLCTEYIAFAVPDDSAQTHGHDLMEELRTPQDGLTIALATARGNVNHIALAYLCRAAGSDPRELRLLVFDSARHAIAASLDGSADVAAVSAASVLPEVDRRLLRVLAVSSPHRLDHPFSAVPTWSELGVECVIGTWRGVVAPPAIEAADVAFWEGTIGAAVRGDAWRDALARHMWADTYMTAAATQAFMIREESLMGAALGELGLVDG